MRDNSPYAKVIEVTETRSRSGSRRELLLAAVFFLALSYWSFGANLFAGQAIAPMDLLSSASGYSEGASALPITNLEKSDILDSLLPAWRYVKSELRARRLPQWDPLPTGGQPALTDLGSGFVSPRFLCFLLFPDALGYSLGLIVELAIAGLGTYLLCRRALRILPSALAGATFMMCGFNAAWAQWPHVSTSCWIPWLLWALARVLEHPSGRRIAALACITALMILGGFPAVAAYGFYLAALIGAGILFQHARATRSVRSTAGLAGAAALGVGVGILLSAVQVLPFLQYLRQFDISHRTSRGIEVAAAAYLLDPFGIGASRVESASYVGLFALLLAALAILLSPLRISRRREPALHTSYWLAALALTWAAVYRWPSLLARALYKLPVLNFNPGNRMLSILGLELAVLAALGLEVCLDLFRVDRQPSDSPLRRTAPIAAACFLMAVHCLDVARVGRAHNAVVPSKAFLPVTPTIEHVRSRILPGQNVLATVDAYFVPGTLGSYGIAEWYAHAYRTRTEKALLEQVIRDPWKTWSAAVFPFEDLDLGSPWIDALGIRFVMTGDRKPWLVAQPRSDRPSPLLTQNRIGQVFRVKEPMDACAISVVFGTYDRDHADADLRLRLHSAGRLLVESLARAEEVINNHPAEFNFGRTVRLDPGEYEFVIESVKGTAASPVSAWMLAGDDGLPEGYLTINGVRAAGDARFQLLGCTYVAPVGWGISRERNGMLVLERKDSPPGGYLVDAERVRDVPAPGTLEWSTVKLTSYSSDRQVFELVASRPSLFVRTMRHWPGWSAFVDGREAQTHAYHDVLAAVEVPVGRHRIEWRYRPAGWRSGLATSAGAVIVALGLTFWERLRRKAALPNARATPGGAAGTGRTDPDATPGRSPATSPGDLS